MSAGWTGGGAVTKIAVVAHSGKTMGGGLPELRKVLEGAGYPSSSWFEVFKSKQAPACARQAVAEGADVLFVWGGDSTVQRCVDAVAGSGVALAVIPAGTANLLAGNLGNGTTEKSPFAVTARGASIKVTFDKPTASSSTAVSAKPFRN
jgi:diacylglycerol kinase (ATP)